MLSLCFDLALQVFLPDNHHLLDEWMIDDAINKYRRVLDVSSKVDEG